MMLGELYKEVEEELESQTKKVKKVENELNQKKVEIQEQSKQIESQKRKLKVQKDEIEEQQAQISKQKEELQELLADVKIQQDTLESIMVIVNKQRDNILVQETNIAKQLQDIKNQESQIAEQQAEIDARSKVLDRQNEEIKDQQERIEEQKETLEQQESQIETQQDILYVIITFLALSVVLAYLIFRSYRIKKEANEKLEAKNAEINRKNEEISRQKDIVERQNEHIKSSIEYAQTIQRAILPMKDAMDQVFESFTLFRPKDIVSGDFFWFSNIVEDNKVFIAAVDCTGHGVPGAFMSMIGNRMLNEIVNEKRIYDPSKILEIMNLEVKKALQQEQSDNNDGMDVCLCRLDKTNGELTKITFSGAKRPLFYHLKGENEIKMIRGDVKSIGGRRRRKKNYLPFTNKELDLRTGDSIYLTTDGLKDQNSPDRRSFGTQRFIDTLLKTAQQPPEEQKRALEMALDEHQKDVDQRDDITVIGVRL